MMDVTGPLRFDQRQTIGAYEQQIRDTQTLLKVQVNETQHCHEHIDILNREIDALRCIIEEKQNLVHQLQNQLKKCKDAQAALEIKYNQSKIDHLAFYDLEQQNLHLLEQLKQKQTALDELEVENRYLREQREDRLVVEETKAKKLNEIEVTFPFERTQLQVRLDHAQNLNNYQAMKIMQLQSQVNDLQSQLSYKEQLSSEQLTRAKQGEYKALLQLDQRDMIMSSLEKQNDELEHSSKVIGQRAKELTAQLDHTLHAAQYAENVYSTVIDTFEQDHLQHTIQQRMSARVNSALTLETQVAAELLQSILSEDGRSNKPKKNLTVPQSPSFGATRRSPLNKFDQQQQTPPRSSTTATLTNNTQGASRNKSLQLQSPNTDGRISAPSTATPKYSETSSSNHNHRSKRTQQQDSLSSPLHIETNSQPTLRQQREERVGTALLHSSAVRSSLTAMALPAGAGAVAELVAVQEACVMLLHRYMRLFCSRLVGENKNIDVAELDLQQCQVNDRDIDIVIDWLRTIPTGSYSRLSSIVLRQNKLSGLTVEKFIAFIISLAVDDVSARVDSGPLLIDLQYNGITEKDINKNIDMLQSSTGKAAGVLKAEFLDNDTSPNVSQVLCLYLACGKPSTAVLVAKIDLSRQQAQDKRPKSGLKYGKKLVRLAYDDRPLAHPEQLIGTFTTATYATGEEKLDATALPLQSEDSVIPRDEVLRLPRDY